MISLNKFSFGPPNNFINAYVTPDGKKIIVDVRELEDVSPGIWVNEHLLQQDENVFIFNVPEHFLADVQLFLKGKYSRMSQEAHDSLRTFSGLNYKRESLGESGERVFETDARLLALTRDEALREELEDLFDTRLSASDELMSPPTKEELWIEKELA